jgi:hypothetical protein
MLKKVKAWIIRKLGGYCAPVVPIQVECTVPIKGIEKALKFYADKDGFLNRLEEGLTSGLAAKLIYEGRVAYHWARTSDPGVERLSACVWALPPEDMTRTWEAAKRESNG